MTDDKTIIADPVGLTIFNPPKGKRACLVQYSGASLGKRYILDSAEMIIGRAPKSGIVLNEGSVSRQHARFFQTGDTVELEDLGTTNGTFVNDLKVEVRSRLRDGDIIRLGTILLKFFAHDNIENVFHDKIYRMATIDAGTQIFNKKYLLESLETEFKFSRTYNRPLSIILYDLDFFKKVNDAFGHNAGDFILKESSTLAKSAIRKEDILARFGGEEFCIILPGTDLKVAHELAERIRAAIQTHVFNFDNRDIKQTISLGVSELKPSMAIPKDLLDDADQKLYKSKKDGRNRVTA
jgi:two-component system, cell cycle response regulator